jgi:hypothetical protein
LEPFVVAAATYLHALDVGLSSLLDVAMEMQRSLCGGASLQAPNIGWAILPFGSGNGNGEISVKSFSIYLHAPRVPGNLTCVSLRRSTFEDGFNLGKLAPSSPSQCILQHALLWAYKHLLSNSRLSSQASTMKNHVASAL